MKQHDETQQGSALMLQSSSNSNGNRKLYIESYGCAMNFSDSELVASILQKKGFQTTPDYKNATLILINTCSIREHAEQRIRQRLKNFASVKNTNPKVLVGILGCMAERLKLKLLEQEKLVDLVVGPDAYRDLPNLIQQVDAGHKAVNVLLSREETYADISPLRLNSNGVTAFVSIMRGCNNMCSFCVVPFTRGRERSRDPHSIVQECKALFQQGYREITLLGQNVDSYQWVAENDQQSVNFAQLLSLVASINPELRIRFSTSHPKDITDEVLYIMKEHDNICKSIHLPVQSGNNRILKMMNRTYDSADYLKRIDAIRQIIPQCAISTDIIVGFCSEAEEEHLDTCYLMEYVQYNFAYMFAYSERPGTTAAKRYADDVPKEVKHRRLKEIIVRQQRHAHFRLQQQIGSIQRVLIEGFSKKSKQDYCGRNDQNAMVVFPVNKQLKPGSYVNVLIERCTTATLIGVPV